MVNFTFNLNYFHFAITLMKTSILHWFNSFDWTWPMIIILFKKYIIIREILWKFCFKKLMLKNNHVLLIALDAYFMVGLHQTTKII